MLSNRTKLSRYLKKYYSIHWLRVVVNIIYVINEIVLSLYLLFIPIQVAYYWLLSNGQNAQIQTKIDISVLVLFATHIVLYLDQKFYEILKNPYAIIWKKILTVQFIYDLVTFFLAIYAVAVVNQSIVQRIIELIFFFKILKLAKFDLKAMYFVIGTSFYIAYKILRTLLIVFMAIAYIGSLFYGVAYILYLDNINVDMLWIVSCPAINDCVDQPFIIQLQYAMYWALGTASTAAYGDISASEPTVVVVNILALAFEGFLFGFYLNSMHSIPQEGQKKQADLLQKFDSFQQHSSDRKLQDKLYLQILCSLEYSQSQKRSLESIEKVMPKKYIQQIKFSMYSQFLLGQHQIFMFARNARNQVLFSNGKLQLKNLSSRQSELFLQIAHIVKETVCQINEDVYKYKNICYDDILYIKQGNINTFLDDELEYITQNQCKEGDYFGIFSFLTGLKIPQRAVCSNYCVIYSISRRDFKNCLNQDENFDFYQKWKKCIQFQDPLLLRQPIMNYVQLLQFNNSSFITYDSEKRYQSIMQKYNKPQQLRIEYKRQNTKCKKIFKYNRNYRHQSTQTQNLQKDPLKYCDLYHQRYEKKGLGEIRRPRKLSKRKMQAFSIQQQ